MRKQSRLTFTEWKRRVHFFLLKARGEGCEAFAGVPWPILYRIGISPGHMTEILVEVARKKTGENPQQIH